MLLLKKSNFFLVNILGIHLFPRRAILRDITVYFSHNFDRRPSAGAGHLRAFKDFAADGGPRGRQLLSHPNRIRRTGSPRKAPRRPDSELPFAWPACPAPFPGSTGCPIRSAQTETSTNPRLFVPDPLRTSWPPTAGSRLRGAGRVGPDHAAARILRCADNWPKTVGAATSSAATSA